MWAYRKTGFKKQPTNNQTHPSFFYNKKINELVTGYGNFPVNLLKEENTLFSFKFLAFQIRLIFCLFEIFVMEILFKVFSCHFIFLILFLLSPREKWDSGRMKDRKKDIKNGGGRESPLKKGKILRRNKS